MKEQVAAQRTRESGRRFKEGMGLSTSLPPPEPNRRLLAFYNICAEYKKAIFKVGPSFTISSVHRLCVKMIKGKEDKEGVDRLVFKF